jgi:endo-1,4-beta-xylanase
MSNVDDLIKQHRTTRTTVTIFQEDKTPLANQEVIVAQKNHKFLFGTAPGSRFISFVNGSLEGEAKEQAERFTEKILDLCNAVTLPFYWGRFEATQGQPATQQLLKAARWWVDHHCRVKGHPLCWHSVCADWLLTMSNQEILQTQVARIKREVADFKGIIDMWDVINEVVIMPIFEKYDNGITRICKDLGRIEMVRTVFEAARSENPAAILLLNDFDMSAAYPILIEGCLEAGIKIDVIGIQSHMHQGYWGVEKTLKILEQFTQFQLPIHFTETNLVSGHLMPPEIVDLNDYQVEEWPTTHKGEERQAQEAVLHYKTLFAHPAVEAITWWDFIDGGWLKSPAGFIRQDASPKLAYEALFKLIKGAWWLAPTSMTTDQDGKIRLTGFLGEYELTWQNNKVTFALNDTGETAITVQL